MEIINVLYIVIVVLSGYIIRNQGKINKEQLKINDMILQWEIMHTEQHKKEKMEEKGYQESKGERK